jgi:hypothetical protein
MYDVEGRRKKDVAVTKPFRRSQPRSLARLVEFKSPVLRIKAWSVNRIATTSLVITTLWKAQKLKLRSRSARVCPCFKGVEEACL